MHGVHLAVTRVGMAALILALATPALSQVEFPIEQEGTSSPRDKAATEIAYTETLRSRDGRSHERLVNMVRNVVTPTLTAYLPSSPTMTRSAVIICPGGGFRFLSWDLEGVDLAKRLAARGVASFVLKYRLVPTSEDPKAFLAEKQAFIQKFISVTAAGKRPQNFDEIFPDSDSKRFRALAASDAQRAMRLVRSRSAEWGISKDNVGMLGFSAGGFLVTDAIFAPDSNSRPSFAALIYGGEIGTHEIPRNAPPLFLAVARDDPWMSTTSKDLFLSWDRAGQRVEMHYFEKGGHGFSTLNLNLPVDHWVDCLYAWLAAQGLAEIADE